MIIPIVTNSHLCLEIGDSFVDILDVNEENINQVKEYVSQMDQTFQEKLTITVSFSNQEELK